MRILAICALILPLFCATSCSRRPPISSLDHGPEIGWEDSEQERDVTNDDRYWGGWHPDASYVLERDLLLDRNSLTVDFYVPPDGPVRTRVSFEAYLESPTDYPWIAVVPKGTTLRCDRLCLRHSMNFTTLDVWGIITSGKQYGTAVHLGNVSISATNRPEGTSKYACQPRRGLITCAVKEVERSD